MRAFRQAEERSSGAAAVEMAVILPVFVLILLGVIDVARLGMAVQLLTTAAREGCRVAVRDGTTAADVQQHVNDVLAGSGIPSPTASPEPLDWSSSRQGTPITLTLSVPYSKVSWLSKTSLFSGATLTASATFSSERP